MTNMKRLKARVESLAKALSEKLGVNVTLNEDGTNSTDTVANINVADPEYYSRLYSVTEEELIALSLHSSIHEAGHIMHTDVYDGVKDVGRAMKYILNKKPRFNVDKTFSLLNMLEDYRMMTQLEFHRKGVGYYSDTAYRVVGRNNISYYNNNKSVPINYIDYAMLKLFAPKILGELKPTIVPKNESKLKKIDTMIDELKALDPKTSTTLDCAELVIKYYTNFYATETRLPSRAPNPSTTPSSTSGEPKDSETDSSKESSKDLYTKSSKDSSKYSKTDSSTDSETEEDVIKDDIEKEISDAIKNDDSKSSLICQTEKLSPSASANAAKGYSISAKTRAAYDNAKHVSSILYPSDDYNVVKFEEINKHASDEFNGTNLHHGYPTVYVEPKDKCDVKDSHKISGVYDASDYYAAAKSGKKLASSLEHILKTSNDDYMSNTRSGVLDHKAIHKHRLSANMFKKRKDDSGGDLCVYMLLDASGSMHGAGDRGLLDSAISIHEAFKTLGVKHRFLSFCTKHATNFDADTDTNPYPNNWYTNYIAEVGNSDYFNASSYRGWGNNRDGLVINLVASMLNDEPESNKVLIILSDGLPNCSSYNDEVGVADTVAAIKNTKKKGMAVTGLFLNHKGMASQQRIKDMKSMYGNDYATVKKSEDIEHAVKNVIKRAVKNFA